MADQPEFADDECRRIESTLKRIRAGLNQGEVPRLEEPAHFFKPEHVNDEE